MIEKTKGIVVHTLSYSEASVIAHIYTERCGMQSFMLNGVRKERARFNANLLQPLTCVELVAYIKHGGSLHRVSEFNSCPAFNSIPYDTVKTTMALFIAEVMYRSIREEEKNEALFDFIYNSVQYLDNQNDRYRYFHLFFMLKLSRYLGFYPQNKLSQGAMIFDMREGVFTGSMPLHSDFLDEETGAGLHELLSYNLESLSSFSLNPEKKKKLLHGIVTYYELHQMHGAKMQSLKILEEVLA